MNMIEQLELFQKNRVPYLQKHILNPPNNHHAIINQWVRWWIDDTNDSNATRGIFDEAKACEGGRHADIMFLEKSSDNIFKIKGVAEVENNIRDNPNKFLEKLDTLKIYDESTDKFPDLEFVILSSILVNEKNKEFFSSLLERAIDYSKDSSLSWIIFIIKIYENTKNEFYIPDYVSNYETYFEKYEYGKEGAYIILQEGKELTKTNWPE